MSDLSLPRRLGTLTPGSRLALLTFGLPFAVYALTMARTWALDTIYAIDSAEMVIAAHTLGIDHPPGHPLYLIFAHLFSQLPFAIPDGGVIFTSVFFGALAAFFLTRTIYEFTGHFWSALFTGWLFAFCRIFWIHATLAEVYTLQLAFLGLFLSLAVRWLKTRDERIFYLLVFSFGLGATTNVLLIVLLAPAFVYLALRSGALLKDGRWQWGKFQRAMLWGALGLTPFLYIPLRLAQESDFISDFVYLNGYEVQSLRWYWWYLSAEEFTSTKILDTPLGQYPVLVLAYLDSYTQNAGFPGPIFALIGLGGAVFYRLKNLRPGNRATVSRKERRQQRVQQRRAVQDPGTFWSRLILAPDRRTGLFESALLLAFLCTLLPVLSYQVPDRDVFFMPSFFFLTALSGLGFYRVCEFLKTRHPALRYAGPLVALATPVYLAIAHYSATAGVNRDTTVYQNRLERFQKLPPNAIIVGEDDGHATRYKYFSLVLDLRPDVTVHTLGRLAPRFTGKMALKNPALQGQDIALSLNVADRLRIVQSLLKENPDRPLFAILDDRMPPEFDHFRTRRSTIDPYLLRVEPKPPPETASETLPVVVGTENAYFKSLRFVGFEIEGLDGKVSRAFPTPVSVSGNTINAIVQRSELFELAFVVQRTTPGTSKVFAEFAFVNDRLEIPSAHGFTAAKQVEVIPKDLPEGGFYKDRLTFKIPQSIPKGIYTLAVSASQTTGRIQGTYQGKPIHTLTPLQTARPWKGQREYAPLGVIWVE